MKSLVCILVCLAPVFAASDEIPFGTTANGGFDINSISSFLDDDGTGSKLEIPKKFIYPSFPSTGPSGYGYKTQASAPAYSNPPIPTPAPVFSLKPAATPTQQEQLPEPAAHAPYQAPTKGYVLNDHPSKGVSNGHEQNPGAATSSSYQTNYRPPNKNYAPADTSGKASSASSSSVFPTSHGSYRPPNKNYVLGDPSLTKGNAQSGNSPFFPQSSTGFGSSPSSSLGNSNKSPSFGSSSISFESQSDGFGSQSGGFRSQPVNFGGQSSSFTVSQSPSFGGQSPGFGGQSGGFGGQTSGFGSQSTTFSSPPGGFGSQTTHSFGSSTPSYDKVTFGNQHESSSSQSGFGNNPSNTFSGNNVGVSHSPTNSFSGSFTSPGSFGGQTKNPNGQFNGFKTQQPAYTPTGFGTTGFGNQNVNFGQAGNFRGQPGKFGGPVFGGQPGKFGAPPNLGGPSFKYQPNFGAPNPVKYGNPNYGFTTNYLIPSNNFGHQPGKFGAPPPRYPAGFGSTGRPGGYSPPPGAYSPQPGAYSPQPGAYSPQPGAYSSQPGAYLGTPAYGQYPGGYKGAYALKEGSYTKGAFNSGRYRRYPMSQFSQYSTPYRGPAAQSSQKSPSYVSPPYSIFEDMMLL